MAAIARSTEILADGLLRCRRCEAVGTIVEMGKCCLVRRMDAAQARRFAFRARGILRLAPRHRALARRRLIAELRG